MKVLYIAALDAGQACDEEAVQHALRVLGHEVYPCREGIGYRTGGYRTAGIDLVLFHKWKDLPTLASFAGVCPRAFWWFDLVDWPGDPTLAGRNEQRRAWMEAVTPHVELGFLSDGDWAATDPRKYRWLPQGADERVVGRGRPVCPTCGHDSWSSDLLFTGIDKGGGRDRVRWVQDLEQTYGPRLHHVRSGVYREQLRNYVAAAKLYLCPASPVSGSYWSNRIWNAAGFAACVLHPWCERLTQMYAPGTEVLYYKSREHMHQLVEQYLDPARAADRHALGEAALARTKAEHLYRHRVEQLLREVKEIKS